MKLEIGNSVVVIKGVLDPDSEEFLLEGWQGRILEIDEETNPKHSMVTIEWDTETLRQMPNKYIEESEIEGLDWKKMVLYTSDIEGIKERDTKMDVKQCQEKLAEQFQWASFGAEGKRILKILEGVDMSSEMKCLERWCNYIEKNVQFPIKAEVDESEDDWIIKEEDKVTVRNLNHIVDMYGIIAGINIGRKRYDYPLCSLKVLNEKEVAYQLIEDYKTWFANR